MQEAALWGLWKRNGSMWTGKGNQNLEYKQSGGESPVLLFPPVSAGLVSEAAWLLELCSGHGKKEFQEQPCLSGLRSRKEGLFRTERVREISFFVVLFSYSPVPRQASYWSWNWAAEVAVAVEAGKAPKTRRGILLSDQRNCGLKGVCAGEESPCFFVCSSCHLVLKQNRSQNVCRRAGRLKALISSWRTRERVVLKTGECERNCGEEEAWEMDPTGSRVWIWP